MNRASPVDIRKALETAHTMADAGLLFVAMPVADEQEYIKRLAEAGVRLAEIAAQCDADEAGGNDANPTKD